MTKKCLFDKNRSFNSWKNIKNLHIFIYMCLKKLEYRMKKTYQLGGSGAIDLLPSLKTLEPKTFKNTYLNRR